MEHWTELGDRLAEPALKLLAAINLFFLASFVFALIAANEARAQDVACTGKNLMIGLDPAVAEKIEAEAAKTINGRGVLWKIEKAGLKPSWLLGTMHMTDPRVTDLTPPAKAAFDGSSTVVIETTDILDQAKMMGQLGSEPGLMMFTDGSSLTDNMSPEDAEALKAGLGKRGIPVSSVAKMKPWMLLAMVALPACEMARRAKGAPVLDAKLALDAKKDGKQLLGLETAAEQLRAMASLPMEFHIRGLVDTLKLGDTSDDVLETMIVLYEQEDVGKFWPLFSATLGEAGGTGEEYAEFEQTMVIKRNEVMASRSDPILAKGGAFIAVGALHLPGPEGVIEKLKSRDYAVTRAE